jgi:ribosome-associated protein
VVENGDGVLRITDTVSIPESELSFRFSRSSGPGGQHVNRSETRVELVFDLMGSPSLSERQKARAGGRLEGYLDKDGVLHLVSQSTRSQLRNREDVVERFRTLLRAALRVRRRRHPTKPTSAAREKRLEEKTRRSETKKRRQRIVPNFE